MKKLPKKFRGADVVRGLGMKEKAFTKLEEQKSYDEFDATREIYVVVDDGALHDRDGIVHAFADKADAVRYARACGCGNINQRVLRVTEQVLVVATENEL